MNESWWLNLDDLDADQQKVIALPLEQDHLVVGPPGSGKTNLLLLRGTYAVRAGKPNVLIIVFTRTLQEFMRAGGQNYAFAPDQIKTLTAWLAGFIRENGEQPGECKTFQEWRDALVKHACAIVDKLKLKGVYDVIILDEAQDYTPDEVRLFRRLGKVLFAAADSEQKIYSTPDSLSLLESLVQHVHHLRFHYRNGLQICELADEIARPLGTHDPLAPTSNYDEEAIPSRYEIIECADVADAVFRAIKTLEVQRSAYPDELLGVVCPDNDTLKAVWDHLKGSSLVSVCVYQNRNEGYLPITTDARICVSTIYSAKGLEFRALHVIGLDRLAAAGRSQTRNTTYTAVTRAKSALSLYSCGKVPPFIQSAAAALREPPPPPALHELFPSTNVGE